MAPVTVSVANRSVPGNPSAVFVGRRPFLAILSGRKEETQMTMSGVRVVKSPIEVCGERDHAVQLYSGRGDFAPAPLAELSGSPGDSKERRGTCCANAIQTTAMKSYSQ